jgi:hypothetical protein
MRGETTVHRKAVMLSEATWQAARAIRSPDWKLIRLYQTTLYGRSGIELYDMRADPHEQHNVADQYPEVAAELDGRLRHWVSAQLAGRHDPMLQVIDAGLPAVVRLNDVIAGQVRPRNDVPTPPIPEPFAVPADPRVAADGVGLHADRPPVPAVGPTATRKRMTERDPAEREAPASARLEEPLGSSSA